MSSMSASESGPAAAGPAEPVEPAGGAGTSGTSGTTGSAAGTVNTAANGDPKPAIRDRLVAAAFELFAAHGFDQTTVDDIAARAGVGRRSFFRYFPSKESVVFPDHDGATAKMGAFLLDEAGFGEDPISRVCDAARMVIAMYAANPEFSLTRYRLTREVPALRQHELSVVRRYERSLASYLRMRYAGRVDGDLLAEVVAAAVVTAHNHALRGWLREGAKGDAPALVDAALDRVRDVFSESGGRGAVPPPEDDVVVVVAKHGTPMWRVVQRVQAALE
jgi:AcrR family transcriptional regulator